MKNSLNEEKYLSNIYDDKKIIFTEDNFLKAVSLIADDIKSKYDLDNKKIGLIGIARGALPLLTAVSHYLNMRNVSIIQIQMTNTDNIKDYGETRFINQMLQEDITDFILLEDIVSHGRCSNFAINHLKEQGKNVLEVYSLVMNDIFKEMNYDIKTVVNYVYLITDSQWVHFVWEKDYEFYRGIKDE